MRRAIRSFPKEGRRHLALAPRGLPQKAAFVVAVLPTARTNVPDLADDGIFGGSARTAGARAAP